MKTGSPENLSPPALSDVPNQEPGDLLLRVGPSLFLLKAPIYSAEPVPGPAGPSLAEHWECRSVFVVFSLGPDPAFGRLSAQGEQSFASAAEAAVLARLRERAEEGRREEAWDRAMEDTLFDSP